MPVNSTLAAQIALSSTTLFPNPASVSVTATETISGSAEFVTVVASASSTTTVYGPSALPTSNTVYFYAHSPSTNPSTPLTLTITGSNTSASIVGNLYPGDFTWIPLNVAANGVTVKVTNATTTASILNIFSGERS
jgi:hypothetical protein